MAYYIKNRKILQDCAHGRDFSGEIAEKPAKNDKKSKNRKISEIIG